MSVSATLLLAAALGQPLALQPNPVDQCFASAHANDPDPQICIDALGNLAEEDPLYAQLLSTLAWQYVRADQVDLGESRLSQALVRGSQDPVVLINAGNIAILAQRFDDAVNHYEAALQLGALNQPVVYLNRSLALRALGRYDEAKLDIQAYLDLSQRPATNTPSSLIAPLDSDAALGNPSP